jgi:hypothetical protein
MNPVEKPAPFIPSASEYILYNFDTTDRIADFLDRHPRPIACARCGFHRPKNSAAALFLEGKKNLLRRLQDIPLTEAEANTVVDGVNAFEKLLTQPSDVPTPEGPTPQLQSGVVQIQATNEESK